MLLENLTEKFKGMKFRDAWRDETFQDLYYDLGIILLSDESNYFDSFDEIANEYADLLQYDDDMKESASESFLDTRKILEIRLNPSLELEIIIDCNYDELEYYLSTPAGDR